MTEFLGPGGRQGGERACASGEGLGWGAVCWSRGKPEERETIDAELGCLRRGGERRRAFTGQAPALANGRPLGWETG